MNKASDPILLTCYVWNQEPADVSQLKNRPKNNEKQQSCEDGCYGDTGYRIVTVMGIVKAMIKRE